MAYVVTPSATAQHHECVLTADALDDDSKWHATRKESNVIVAIKRHDSSSVSRDEPIHQYLWIKGKKSNKVEQLHKVYANRYGVDESLIDLKFGDRTLYQGTRMGDVDLFPDGIIALEVEILAPPNKDIASPVSEQPDMQVSPVSGPGHDLPFHAATASGSQPVFRQPLQEVNRQLTLPPQQPTDDTIEKQTSYSAPFAWIENQPSPAFMINPNRSCTPKTTASATQSISISRTHKQHAAHSPEPVGVPASQEYEPRVEEDAFAQPSEGTDIAKGKALRQLAQHEDPDRLEAAVRAGVALLADLQKPLERLTANADAQSWVEQIETVRKEAVKSRTVVGVVGNTGAGKSSVINAMLDEERLVPTNCMRACTAVVTELSYNYSDSVDARYRAEIEFIRPQDWRKELSILFREVFDESGHISKEIYTTDSQASIAYAKIRAVYHKMTKDDLANTSVESLMRVKTIQRILGTTKRINERHAPAFYKRLQQYVDSKEKGQATIDENGKKIKRKRELEFWPLIKVVKIYTKADALSKGSVVVDLPGVHDSNAARAAVAEGYMKQCSGLWIVAPITRAVDDRAAKTLLGDSFKRQLKYDGIYSAVTFICSKTDDISRMEATDSLKLGDKMDKIDKKLSHLSFRRRELSRELTAAKADKVSYAETIEDADERLEHLEELELKVDNGQTVYADVHSNNKRKRASTALESRKRQRNDTEDVACHDSDHNGVETPECHPLTSEQITKQMDNLKAIKKEARRERSKVDERIRELSESIGALDREEAELDAEQNELCIAGRNEYSRSAIREDFATGIRELDQETAEEEDPDNFNPEEDARDYDEVARSLPVFCVSSRAYQKLSGRLQKDNDVAGFTKKEQTEIPQLQAHCKKLTENGRQASSRRFLNSLSQLLNSMDLWASDDGTGIRLGPQEQDVQKRFLVNKLKELRRSLDKSFSNTLDDCIQDLETQLFPKFQSAAAAAAATALQTSDGWGAHKNDGGLMWATYKATVRRDGVFSGASGPRDFNSALTEPIYKTLSNVWEKLFQRRLPTVLQSSTKSGTNLLQKFHAAVDARCRENGHGIARLGLLNNQLPVYRQVFVQLANEMIGHMNEAQREINREFTPMITTAMSDAYERCAVESGTGSFKRMKAHMHEHVEEMRDSMFVDACHQVRQRLKDVCEHVRINMLERVNGVFTSMQRDYMSTIGGTNVDNVVMPREELSVRQQLDDIISDADASFEEIADADVKSLPTMNPAEGPQDDSFVSASGHDEAADDADGLSEEFNDDDADGEGSEGTSEEDEGQE